MVGEKLKFGGEFRDSAIEQAFTVARHEETLRQCRLLFLLSAALNTLFLLSDWRFAGTPHFFIAVPARLSVVMFSLLCFLMVRRTTDLGRALAATLLFRKELGHMGHHVDDGETPVPLAIAAVHLVFLALVVVFAHHPAVFMGLFLFFMGFTTAYERHQNPLILREALLVAFFLGGRVVLGGMQQWWLQPALMAMNADQVYFGATALTAITDNAALTYLGSLITDISDPAKYMLGAGAVAAPPPGPPPPPPIETPPPGPPLPMGAPSRRAFSASSGPGRSAA